MANDMDYSVARTRTRLAGRVFFSRRTRAVKHFLYYCDLRQASSLLKNLKTYMFSLTNNL